MVMYPMNENLIDTLLGIPTPRVVPVVVPKTRPLGSLFKIFHVAPLLFFIKITNPVGGFTGR
jgi:hypothetical protein